MSGQNPSHPRVTIIDSAAKPAMRLLHYRAKHERAEDEGGLSTGERGELGCAEGGRLLSRVCCVRKRNWLAARLENSYGVRVRVRGDFVHEDFVLSITQKSHAKQVTRCTSLALARRLSATITG